MTPDGSYRIATPDDTKPNWRVPTGQPDDGFGCTFDYGGSSCGVSPATATVEDGQDGWRGSARCATHLDAEGEDL